VSSPSIEQFLGYLQLSFTIVIKTQVSEQSTLIKVSAFQKFLKNITKTIIRYPTFHLLIKTQKWISTKEDKSKHKQGN